MTREASTVPHLRRRARRAIIALWFTVAVGVLAILANIFGIVAAERALSAATESQIETAKTLLDTNIRLQLAVVLGTLIGILAMAVTFLMWFYRGHRLLHEAGYATRYTPVWAVGSWFVPFVNLVIPKRAANDLWRAGSHDRVTSLLHWWWAVWLIAVFVNTVVGRVFLRIETLADFRDAYSADSAASVLYICAALLAIAVVRRTTSRLEAPMAEGPPTINPS